MTRRGDIPRTWRLRYIAYRHGPRIAYLLLGLGCFLALLANTALYRDQQAADRRQDANSARLKALVAENEAGRQQGGRLLCEVADFIEKRAKPSDDLETLRALAALRCRSGQ